MNLIFYLKISFYNSLTIFKETSTQKILFWKIPQRASALCVYACIMQKKEKKSPTSRFRDTYALLITSVCSDCTVDLSNILTVAAYLANTLYANRWAPNNYSLNDKGHTHSIYMHVCFTSPSLLINCILIKRLYFFVKCNSFVIFLSRVCYIQLYNFG